MRTPRRQTERPEPSSLAVPGPRGRRFVPASAAIALERARLHRSFAPRPDAPSTIARLLGELSLN